MAASKPPHEAQSPMRSQYHRTEYNIDSRRVVITETSRKTRNSNQAQKVHVTDVAAAPASQRMLSHIHGKRAVSAPEIRPRSKGQGERDSHVTSSSTKVKSDSRKPPMITGAKSIVLHGEKDGPRSGDVGKQAKREQLQKPPEAPRLDRERLKTPDLEECCDWPLEDEIRAVRAALWEK